MSIGINIGQAISGIRKERGLSQIQLANLIGITQTAMSMIETGKCQPSKVTLSKIAEALGVWAPEILLKGIDWNDIPEEAKERIDAYLGNVITN